MTNVLIPWLASNSFLVHYMGECHIVRNGTHQCIFWLFFLLSKWAFANRPNPGPHCKVCVDALMQWCWYIDACISECIHALMCALKHWSWCIYALMYVCANVCVDALMLKHRRYVWMHVCMYVLAEGPPQEGAMEGPSRERLAYSFMLGRRLCQGGGTHTLPHHTRPGDQLTFNSINVACKFAELTNIVHWKLIFSLKQKSYSFLEMFYSIQYIRKHKNSL